ncbi:MAG: oligosaccharide flippase family protein [Anaerolineae bacterium]|nr:oligosaccharide flippase family protein [Anaerolineae bacterium]
MSRFKPLLRDLLVVAALLILPLVLYWDVTIGGQTMLPIDNLFQWAPYATYAADFGVEQPQNSLLSDLILENIVWKQFINDSVSNGEIPLWNPHLFAGQPFLANGQHSAYYPFSVLFMILPLTAAYGWFTVLQLWLAGVSMYVFGRILAQKRASAAIAGLIYQGSGFLLVSSAVFPMILAAAVWLPLLLACIEMIIRITTTPKGAGKTLPWATLGAFALGLQLFAGHPEITYYTLLLMALFAAWRLLGKLVRKRGAVKHLVKPAIWLFSMVGVGIMLGSLQLLPSLELAQTNFREDSASFEEVRGWAFPERRILTLALPNFFGNPSHHEYTDILTSETVALTTNFYGESNPHGAGSSNWGIKNYVEGGIYLGILPLVLTGFGIWGAIHAPETDPKNPSRRRTLTLFFVVLGFFSLAFIFGTPLYALLYYGLPFINQLHSPFRWVFALSLCVAALSGFGVDYLLGNWDARKVAKTHRETRGRLVGITLIVVGAVILGGLFVSRAVYPQLEPVVERVFTGLAQAPDAFPSALAFYSYLFPQILTLGIVVVLSGVVLWLAGRWRYWPVLAFVLIVADLFVANQGFHAGTDPGLLDFKPQMVQFLEQQPGDWRFTSFESRGGKPFNANMGWLFGFDDVRGYDSIINKQYTDYMTAIEPQNELPFNRVAPLKDWQSINSPLLDLLGVKFIISDTELDLPKLQEVWRGEDVIVYENLAVVPRAYTIPHSAALFVDEALPLMAQEDPRTTLFVEGRDPGFERVLKRSPAPLTQATATNNGNLEVVVAASVDEPSWIVLNDSYAPGWKAFVRPADGGESDEQEVAVYRVNGNFRGVFLDEAGDYAVRFRYSPTSFKLAGLATFMGTIIVAFAFGVWLWRRYYRPNADLTNTQSIAKNSMVPMALNLFNKLIDFMFAAFYLRVLGPEENGAYATAIAIAMWFEIIANWGLNTFVIREVSQDRSQALRYLFNTTLLRIFTTAIAAIPIFLYIFLVAQGPNPLGSEIVIAIVLLAIGMIFSSMGQGVAGLFYAFESAEYPAAVATVTTIFKVGFGVIVLLLGWSFVGLAGVSIVVNLITLLILIVMARRILQIGGDWTIDMALQRDAFKRSYPLMLNHLLATIFWLIDVPLLRQINGDAVVGIYNAAYKWVNAFNVIPSFLTFALFPVISRQVNSNLDDARRTFRMSAKLLTLIALPLAAVVTLLAPIMIGVLGGAAFLPDGATALQIVIWSIPIGWLNSVTNYVVISLGMERRLTRAFMIGVAFNFIGNLILLPYLSFVGAALTTIASEIILLIAFNYFVKVRMQPIGWVNLLWKPFVITGVMLLVMLAVSQVSLVVGLLAGLIVYPAGLWLMKVFGEEERFILASILPGSVASKLGLSGNQ